MSGGAGQRGRVDAAVMESFSPWSQSYEDKATAAWRAVMSLTPEAARQERRAITEMIERLEWLIEGETA